MKKLILLLTLCTLIQISYSCDKQTTTTQTNNQIANVQATNNSQQHVTRSTGLPNMLYEGLKETGEYLFKLFLITGVASFFKK